MRKCVWEGSIVNGGVWYFDNFRRESLGGFYWWGGEESLGVVVN